MRHDGLRAASEHGEEVVDQSALRGVAAHEVTLDELIEHSTAASAGIRIPYANESPLQFGELRLGHVSSVAENWATSAVGAGQPALGLPRISS